MIMHGLTISQLILEQVNKSELSLVHATPGRSRYLCPAIYRNPSLCNPIENRLRVDPSIDFVQANWRTGSLLLIYDEQQPLDLVLLNEWIAELVRNPESYQNRDDGRRTLTNIANNGLKSAADRAMQAADELISELKSDIKNGLKSSGLAAQSKKYGVNYFEATSPTSHWMIFCRQFANSQTALLASSAGLSMFTGGMFDLVLIGSVIFLNGYIGYLTELRSDQIICSIGLIESQMIEVVRDGVRQSILDKDLLAGDIVYLKVGLVPADIRLLDSKGIMVDESPLTGEAMPVAKYHAPIKSVEHKTILDLENILFRGTTITSGQAVGVVIATGRNTEIGRVKKLVEMTEEMKSPMEQDLQNLGKETVIFSTVVCGAVFFMGLMRSRAWIEMLRTSISLVIAAVPEGLPTIGTTTMAIGVADMKKKNVFVRRLNVLENIASIEILCLDKTGTLTMNDMIAEGGYFAFQAWHRRDFEQEARTLNRLITGSESLSVARRWSMIAALCTDCERLSLPNELGERWVGSSTEKAIIQIAELMGADFESQQLEMPRFKVSYRTEARQYMVTYHKLKDTNVHIAAVKGNPDQVLDLCAWLQEGVSVRAMDADAYQRLKEQNKELAQRGLRVLGFAYVEEENLESIKNRKIIWLGSVGLMDPMREGMTELIEKFHVAGIKAIMLTGDQTETAEALGIALGFNKSGRLLKTIDARMLSELSLDEIADLAEFTQVFSRVSPSDKLRIVKALQGRGKIVAMTGDGINDSPALKAAHVGIALGFQGSSAARESADIVLKDDNLQILYHIIEKGRSIRTNLQKSIKYLLATNLSEIVLMFVSIGLGRGSPLNAVQLLWINLLTDILPGLALALDPPAADCMQQGPSSPYDSLINERARYRLLFEAGLMGAGALVSYEQSARQGGSQKQNTSATFISLTVSQILHTLSASAGEKGLIYGDSPRNRQVYIAMSFASTTLFLGLVSPWFRSLLGNEGLPPGGLRKAMGHGAWPFVLSETFKIFANHNRTQSLA